MKVTLALNTNNRAAGRHFSPDNDASFTGPEPQLELGFAAVPRPRSPGPRRPGQGGAAWWFQRMRQLVDCARNWPPAPPPSGGLHPLRGTAIPQATSVRRQICETPGAGQILGGGLTATSPEF